MSRNCVIMWWKDKAISAFLSKFQAASVYLRFVSHHLFVSYLSRIIVQRGCIKSKATAKADLIRLGKVVGRNIACHCMLCDYILKAASSLLDFGDAMVVNPEICLNSPSRV